jgi:aspartate 1-decarboxylase
MYAPEDLDGYIPRIVVLDKANSIKKVMHVEEAQHPYRG